MQYDIQKILLNLKYCEKLDNADFIISKKLDLPFTKVNFYFNSKKTTYKAIGCQYFLACCELTAWFIESNDNQNQIDYYLNLLNLPAIKQVYIIIFEDIIYEYKNFKKSITKIN
jgi:hypothetical protein